MELFFVRNGEKSGTRPKEKNIFFGLPPAKKYFLELLLL
jgi:hypothetical protein